MPEARDPVQVPFERLSGCLGKKWLMNKKLFLQKATRAMSQGLFTTM